MKKQRIIGIIIFSLALVIAMLMTISIMGVEQCMEENELTYHKSWGIEECSQNNIMVNCNVVHEICGTQDSGKEKLDG